MDVAVVLDTTTTKTDPSMTSIPWNQLLTLSAERGLLVAVPEVVVRETARHRDRLADDHLNSLKAIARKNAGRLKKLRELGYDVSWDGSDASPIVRGRRGGRDYVAERLTSVGARVLPLPNLTLEAVLERDLRTDKPFQESGKGFRDTLIWASLVEFAVKLPAGTTILFVTNNTGDFCDSDGQLHPTLASELETRDLSVLVVPDLPSLLSHDLLKSPVASLTAAPRTPQDPPSVTGLDEEPSEDEHSLDALISNTVLAACDDLAGEDVRLGSRSPSGLPFDHFNMPVPLEDAAIGEAIPSTEVVEWQTYETYEGGTLLVRASVPCELELEGWISKGNYHALDRADVDVRDWSHADDAVQAAVRVDANLIFQLRVEAETMFVSEVELESAELL